MHTWNKELRQSFVEQLESVKLGCTVWAASFAETTKLTDVLWHLRVRDTVGLIVDEPRKGEVLDLSGMIAQLSNTLKGSRL